jgi:hypothetical protein
LRYCIFKNGATIVRLNAAVTNLNVWGILMSHCGIDENIEYTPLVKNCKSGRM